MLFLYLLTVEIYLRCQNTINDSNKMHVEDCSIRIIQIDDDDGPCIFVKIDIYIQVLTNLCPMEFRIIGNCDNISCKPVLGSENSLSL